MDDTIKDRVIQVANFVIQNQSTIREAAKAFHISATTVSQDLRIRLPYIDPNLSDQVGRILRHNTEVRAYRGGESTRRKYRNKKNRK